MTLRIAVAALVIAASPVAGYCAQEVGDLVAVCRPGLAAAAKSIGWRGPELSDDVALALVAAGTTRTGSVVVRHGKAFTYAPLAERKAALRRAVAEQDEGLALAAAISLTLDPEHDPQPDALAHLERYGADYDRLLIAMLQAPPKLPVVSRLRYAAADMLASRSSVRLLPVFLALAGSEDAYIRSRAITGLGIVGFVDADGSRAAAKRIRVGVREASISMVERRMIDEAVRDAVRSASYRVRAAAALALALTGTPVPDAALKRLAKDPAYVVESAGRDRARITFPVRDEAAVLVPEPVVGVARSGEYSARALRDAKRGGRDVTKDTAGLIPGLSSRIRFSEGTW